MKNTVLEYVPLVLKAHSGTTPWVIVLTVILKMLGELSAIKLLP